MRPTPVLLIAAAFAAASAVASAHERVRPSAHPSHPSQSERVVIRFRARETLDGVYYAQVRHRPKEPGCDAQESRVVPAPSKGRFVRITLRPPRVDGQPDARQWCVGTYRVKVFFKQTLQCPPPIQCGDSVAVSLGSTTFTVVAGPLPGT